MTPRIEITKKEPKKVYALLLESPSTTFLSVQYARSLEEAFALAKLEFEQQHLGMVGLDNPLMGSKIVLFAIKEVKELTMSPNLLEKAQHDAKVMEEEAYQRVEKERERDVEKFVKDYNPKDFEQPAGKTGMLKALTSTGFKYIPLDGKEAKKTKSELMVEIIRNKDVEAFKKNRGLFTPAERKYIQEHLK